MAKTTYTDKEGFFKLFRLFMKESGNGTRLKKDGRKIRSSTIDNYIYAYKLLERFVNETGFDLHFIEVSRANKRDFEAAKKYWKKFYLEFTDYMYKDLDYYDNYVGLVIKSLRTFFNYVKEERNIDIGSFHKTFYVPKEEIAIIALSPEQVNYLINNKELNNIMPIHLHRIRDMFVFGCTVCLRVSDLLAIKPQNIVTENGGNYLRVSSKKTGIFTSVKLPDYAMDIVVKYRTSKRSTLFPSISKDRFNAALKDMGKYLEYNEPIVKTRTKRGVECVVYKNKTKKQHHTLADMITTHTMRRTGITTMLRMGMPDYLVRKISGHAASSKEFFRYVQLAQNYLDKHTDEAFEKLKNLN
jgi:integrase